MAEWQTVAYLYDGGFSGFLTCVYESYVHREAPACFAAPEDPRVSLWPERRVEAHGAHARRVYRSLGEKIAPGAKALVTRGFLTCMPERELQLWRFIQAGYRRGSDILQDLADPMVAALNRAVYQLNHEAHMYTGFVRFSEQAGVLVAEIAPKNRVLPVLRSHFCTRFSRETFVIYDRTYREALFYQPGRWAIVPLAEFRAAAPEETELDFRRLWRRFYDAIAIQDRHNPKLRMSNMPKRYWHLMTEFQSDEGGMFSRAIDRADGRPAKPGGQEV